MNIDHASSESHCLSSDRTGAYVHALSTDHSPRDCASSLISPPQDDNAGEVVLSGEEIPGDSDMLVSTEINLVHPGLVPFVSHRAGAYGRLLLATYERMMTDGLPTCDWLMPVTRDGWLLQLAWGRLLT